MRRVLNDYMREHVKEKVVDQGRQEDAIAHLMAFGGDDKIASIDIPWSRRYVKARREGDVGGSTTRAVSRVGSLATIKRELNVLVAAMNHARRWKRLDIVPSIEKPQEDRPDGDVQKPFFDKAVLHRMFTQAAADAEDARLAYAAAETLEQKRVAKKWLTVAVELHQWMRIAYYTAARRRSIEDLTAPQVSLLRRQITLASPGKLRTKKRQPIVPIFDEIVPDVTALLAKGTHRLFETNDFYDPFIRLCVRLDLPEPHNPHMLRHSRATHLLQDGKDLWDVAKLLGDTVSTVESVYGHHSPNELMRKLG